MIRLIVNADDLGSGPARDRGIFRAFRDGIVTSASLLANGPSFAPAAAEARALGLPLGVHLNLSEGPALAGPIPELTTSAGEFPGKTATRAALASARIDSAALRRELTAQVEKVLDAGLIPDHLDTHQHTFLFPTVAAAVVETARAFGVRAVRRPAPAEPAAADPVGTLGEELALYRLLAPAASSTIDGAGLAAPDALLGMPLLERLDAAALVSLLGELPAGAWELMVHPGYSGDLTPFAGAARERELAALLDPELPCLLQRRSIRLITFGELSCAS